MVIPPNLASISEYIHIYERIWLNVELSYRELRRAYFLFPVASDRADLYLVRWLKDLDRDQRIVLYVWMYDTIREGNSSTPSATVDTMLGSEVLRPIFLLLSLWEYGKRTLSGNGFWCEWGS